jgi:hypothetical protein
VYLTSTLTLTPSISVIIYNDTKDEFKILLQIPDEIKSEKFIIDFGIYDLFLFEPDLNEFGSAQQQPRLESAPIVDSPNFIHEHISDVVNDDLAAAKRNTQNGYAKKYRLKKAAETRKNKNQLADLTKSNEKLNEQYRKKASN